MSLFVYLCASVGDPAATDAITMVTRRSRNTSLLSDLDDKLAAVIVKRSCRLIA